MDKGGGEGVPASCLKVTGLLRNLLVEFILLLNCTVHIWRIES